MASKVALEPQARGSKALQVGRVLKLHVIALSVEMSCSLNICAFHDGVIVAQTGLLVHLQEAPGFLHGTVRSGNL